MKARSSPLGGRLVALLLARSAVRAQMSPDLILETYNSNVSVITNGIINKPIIDKAIARNHAGRTAERGFATTQKVLAEENRQWWK